MSEFGQPILSVLALLAAILASRLQGGLWPFQPLLAMISLDAKQKACPARDLLQCSAHAWMSAVTRFERRPDPCQAGPIRAEATVTRIEECLPLRQHELSVSHVDAAAAAAMIPQRSDGRQHVQAEWQMTQGWGFGSPPDLISGFGAMGPRQDKTRDYICSSQPG